MSKKTPVDPIPHLRAVAEAQRQSGQPDRTFAALDHALAAVLGHKLFTVLRYHEDTGESERLYTNQPAAYPVGGRKPLNTTPWTQQVLREQRPYLGRTHADIRAVFFDHELITSLGCGSILNLPVATGGRILGTLNVLHEEHWYDDGDVGIGQVFAALAVPAYLNPDAKT